ncbi:hypothetical protein PIB30_093098 [Stylosanthes scabra]|uniref:Pentatricopeptide repeat-containing protein n=1 Tax=Stylosanthes scabra TaxID=79078 RepID=A0ABU6QVD2_9FABA|nr:hypothetical protein [Stylosanthes scabra]
MIAAYANCNAYELVLFDWMREDGLVPDKVAMVTVVNACAKLGAMHRAKFINHYILRNSFSLDVILGTAMIDMFAKCGSVESARVVFDRMKERNVITRSSMLAAYGLIEEGLRLFYSMWKEHAIRPDVKHYTCMVDLLGRADRLDDAIRLIEAMDVEKDDRLWSAVELAEKAADSLLELHPQNPGHYVLLSNIYAKAGK